MSGWSSRLGNWGGRFSPFGRPNGSSGDSVRVTESDYSYITSADIENADSGAGNSTNTTGSSSNGTFSRASAASSGSLDPGSADGRHSSAGRDGSRSRTRERTTDTGPDTDVLLLKHKRVSHPVHFPSGSIANGELTIGEIRQLAAHRLNVSDQRRIKLLHRGRNLRSDHTQARDFGLVPGTEIMCVVGEAVTSVNCAEPGYRARGGSGRVDDKDTEDADEGNVDGDERHHPDDDSSDGVSTEREQASERSPDAGSSRKRRSRPGKQGRHRRRSPHSSPDTEHHKPPSNTAPLPTTPAGRLDRLADRFHATLVPQCQTFIKGNSTDKAKRELEHRRLTETILSQVLLELDAVDTDGEPEARKRRKEIVKECQDMLATLDEALQRH